MTMELPYKADLKGKTVVLTSDGSYLCDVFSKALALCGANVAILDYQKSDADEVADEVNRIGGKALGVEADLLNTESLMAARELINREFGPCDILVNATRRAHPKGMTTKEYFFPEDLEKQEGVVTFFDIDPDAVEEVYRRNFMAVLVPTQVFARDMIGRKDPVIVNITSLNAYKPLTKILAYSAAKAALQNFTLWLAVHFSKVGIRVNAIAPGFVMTEHNKAWLFNPDGTFLPRVVKELNQTPAGRMAEDWEFAGPLLWLVDSKASSYVTGTVIPVDGGFTAYPGV